MFQCSLPEQMMIFIGAYKIYYETFISQRIVQSKEASLKFENHAMYSAKFQRNSFRFMYMSVFAFELNAHYGQWGMRCRNEVSRWSSLMSHFTGYFSMRPLYTLLSMLLLFIDFVLSFSFIFDVFKNLFIFSIQHINKLRNGK